MRVRRAASINGEINLPGDKSISHRAALIASIAEGKTRLRNFAASADCASTLACLAGLGVDIERDGPDVMIKGVSSFVEPIAELDCGNSGTTMRLLAGVLAGQPFTTTLTGDSSLNARPMQRIIEPLRSMGAVVDSQDGRAPLVITGRRPLAAIDHRPAAPSAQVKSCILLAGLAANGETSVLESVPTRDHTERMLGWFGVDVSSREAAGGTRISVHGGQRVKARDISIPGDISSAAFFIAAAVCLPGSEIILRGVGLNKSRRAFVDLVAGMGSSVEIIDEHDVCNEPVGTVHIRSVDALAKNGGPTIINGAMVADLIDEIPILAVLGTQLENGMIVRDASELRVKESDRIASIVSNLRRMGADVTEFDDGFQVRRSMLRGAVIDPSGDHRIAMAFAIAGLLADGETVINDPECVDISFPGFFETLADVVRC